MLSPVPGFPGCSVGKHQSEHLGSHLLNRVAVYWCVLQGSWENKHCQLWSAQVLRARCLLKINGRGKKASWEGVQRSPVFMMKEMQILARILLPVHLTHRVTHAFSPLWQEGGVCQTDSYLPSILLLGDALSRLLSCRREQPGRQPRAAGDGRCRGTRPRRGVLPGREPRCAGRPSLLFPAPWLCGGAKGGSRRAGEGAPRRGCGRGGGRARRGAAGAVPARINYLRHSGRCFPQPSGGAGGAAGGAAAGEGGRKGEEREEHGRRKGGKRARWAPRRRGSAAQAPAAARLHGAAAF